MYQASFLYGRLITELTLIDPYQLVCLPIHVAGTKPHQELKILSDSLGKKL
jgi:hypothetical protein